MGDAAVYQALGVVCVDMSDDKCYVGETKSGSTTNGGWKGSRSGLDKAEHIPALDIDKRVLVADIGNKNMRRYVRYFTTHDKPFVGSEPDDTVAFNAGFSVGFEAVNRQHVSFYVCKLLMACRNQGYSQTAKG